jgi:vacuolar protein sorting-associated protein 13A/C
VKITIIQEVPTDGSQAVFKYVACRVLSLAVEVDSATVKLLFTDLLDDLKILTHSQALALSMPDRWLNEFNMKQLYPQQQLRMVKVYRSKIQAQQSKMYFKNLIIHPVKITFTFAQTTFPRRQHKETLQSTVLNVLMSLVGVEKLRLHLRSFEVEDAMESIGTLVDMVSSKTMQDVRSQLTQIAGSLTMLGSPIGFARKVGSGVKAFFYEPYQGAVQGSGDFFVGLGRGTTTLFTGVVSGAMDSAVAIVGTASKGMSHLSGDADYVRKRAIKRQQGKVNGGGILQGFQEGGESVLSGKFS